MIAPYRFCKAVVESLAPDEVVIRLLEGGARKCSSTSRCRPNQPVPGLSTNPRVKHPRIVKMQLRAILRASGVCSVLILLPMICSMGEVVETRKISEADKMEIGVEKQPCNLKIRMGELIETPAAAILTKQLAAELDFFSIATKDSIPHLQATDQTSPQSWVIKNRCNQRFFTCLILFWGQPKQRENEYRSAEKWPATRLTSKFFWDPALIASA
jgi:phosphotransferase system enzyme I (PtsI)